MPPSLLEQQGVEVIGVGPLGQVQVHKAVSKFAKEHCNASKPSKIWSNFDCTHKIVQILESE